MEEVLFAINGVACLAISAALLFCVVSPRVDDGIVMKIGLGCMSASFGALSYHLSDGLSVGEERTIERALLLLTIGVVLVAAPKIHRVVCHPGDSGFEA